MHEYLCVDGPLAGQTIDWREVLHDGEILTTVLVDVDAEPHADPEADYRVERTPHEGLPGRLRFVVGRGSWRAPAALGAAEL